MDRGLRRGRGERDRSVNPQTIADLIAPGEGQATEFKRGKVSGLGREICAFANSDGGVALLGVDDDGRFFVRDGASSQQMSRDEVHELFHVVGAIRFDEVPCGRFSLDEDIDEDNWELFRRRAGIPEAMEPKTALRNLSLLAADGRMTNAGAWLLAKDITKFSLSAEVVCGLFRGADKTHIIDRRGFDGDVCTMIDDAMAWIESKINVNYIITGAVRRIRDLCREWDVAAPVFDISDHWVTVTFPRPAVSRQGAKGAGKGSGRDQVGTRSRFCGSRCRRGR